jgi:hypothetical protein
MHDISPLIGDCRGICCSALRPQINRVSFFLHPFLGNKRRKYFLPAPVPIGALGLARKSRNVKRHV